MTTPEQIVTPPRAAPRVRHQWVVRLTHWAWLAMVLVLALLFASSAWRLWVSPPPPVVPLVEMTLELACLAYLSRPRVRGAFARR